MPADRTSPSAHHHHHHHSRPLAQRATVHESNAARRIRRSSRGGAGDGDGVRDGGHHGDELAVDADGDVDGDMAASGASKDGGGRAGVTWSLAAHHLITDRLRHANDAIVQALTTYHHQHHNHQIQNDHGAPRRAPPASGHLGGGGGGGGAIATLVCAVAALQQTQEEANHQLVSVLHDTRRAVRRVEARLRTLERHVEHAGKEDGDGLRQKGVCCVGCACRPAEGGSGSDGDAERLSQFEPGYARHGAHPKEDARADVPDADASGRPSGACGEKRSRAARDGDTGHESEGSQHDAANDRPSAPSTKRHCAQSTARAVTPPPSPPPPQACPPRENQENKLPTAGRPHPPSPHHRRPPSPPSPPQYIQPNHALPTLPTLPTLRDVEADNMPAPSRPPPPACARCRVRKRADMHRLKGFIDEEVYDRWARIPGNCLQFMHQDEPGAAPSPMTFADTETCAPP